MKYTIKKMWTTFLLFLLFFVGQVVKASDSNKDIIEGAVEQVNYLLKNNLTNIANGKSTDNWYVYFLGGNLENLEFVLNKRKDTDFSANYLYQLNEALKNINKNKTAVYVAFTAYNEELITPIFPDNLATLNSMEGYLRSDVLIKEFGINADTKAIALSSFQKYSTKFQATYREILQEVYDKSNFKTTDFDNIIIPFTNYSSRQIIQQDGDYVNKKYDMYSLYLPKVNANFNYEDYKKTYRETDVFAPQYGLQRIEQKIERIVLSLDIYFNQGGSIAKTCESLLYDPKLQDVIKELKQDDAWKAMIEENPCILNTIYPNLNLYSNSAQFEKDLALFVCAPLYAAMAVPAGAIIGEAAFVELAKYLIKKHGADKIKNVSQAIAANIIMQTGYNYYFGEDYITNTRDTSERWLLALKAIDKGDLGKDVLVAAYELDYRSELVLTCLNDGLQIDINNLYDTKFNINECLSSVTRDILLKMFFDTSSATIKSALKRIKANPAIFKKGFREMLVDAGQDGRKALSESLEEIKKAFEPKGPLIRIVNVEAKYGFEADNAANVEPLGTNKIEFSNKVKNVLLELEKQIDNGDSDIIALGTNIQLNPIGLSSIKSTILAETANGYKIIFLETGDKIINTIDDYVPTTNNRIQFLNALKNGNINKATLVGANAEDFFGGTKEIDINTIDVYSVDTHGNITGHKEFKLAEIMNGSESLVWLNDLLGVLPSEAKRKISTWVNDGLDESKLKSAFNTSADKKLLYNKLNLSKGINHQKAIINDYIKIPGVTQGSFVSNAVDNVTSNISKTADSRQFTMYSGQAKTFVKNASLSLRKSIEVVEDLGNGIQFIKIKSGTKLYRVFDGYKPWDDISMTGNTLPNGSFWTFDKPTLVSEVIEGTAVMPEWNGMTKIIEVEVPSTGLFGWYGKAAKQTASSNTTSFYLKGGKEQIIINFGQNQQIISSVTTNITSAPWIK